MAEQNDATKAAETARKDAEKAAAAEKAAQDAKLSPEERKAKEARERAGDSEAKAVDAEARSTASESEDATAAEDVKSVSAAANPDLNIGAHSVQTFANTPENPQLAPGLNPEEGATVRMEITDSDHPDPAHPKVTYVHPEMVGDYLRAGWRRPVA